jgi:Protein of unknown function (DUF1161)
MRCRKKFSGNHAMKKSLSALLAVAGMLLAAPCLAAGRSCDDVKAEIAAKLDAKGVKGYVLEAVSADKVAADARVVGSCEAGTKKIIYTRG